MVMGQRDTGTLVIDWQRGGTAALRYPIPRIAAVSMVTLSAISLREWIVMTADDIVSICDHDWHITGWQVAPKPALVMTHQCCGAAR